MGAGVPTVMTQREASRRRGARALAVGALSLCALGVFAGGASAAAPVRGLAQVSSFPTPLDGITDSIEAFTSDGASRLYFGHADGRISVTSNHGKRLGDWATEATEPAAGEAARAYSLAASPGGEVAVARPGLNRVERYTARGALIDEITGSDVVAPEAVAYAPDGTLYVRVVDGVLRVAANGNVVRVADVPAGLQLAVGSGREWLTSENGLAVYRGGRLSALVGSGSARHRIGDYHYVTDTETSDDGGAWALDLRLHHVDALGRTDFECSMDLRKGTPTNLGRSGRTLFVPTGAVVRRFRERDHPTRNCKPPRLRFKRLTLTGGSDATRPSKVAFTLTRRAKLRLQLYATDAHACGSARRTTCDQPSPVVQRGPITASRAGSIKLDRLSGWSHLKAGTYLLRVLATTSTDRADHRLLRFTVGESDRSQ